jgi:hypothetical protein
MIGVVISLVLAVPSAASAFSARLTDALYLQPNEVSYSVMVCRARGEALLFRVLMERINGFALAGDTWSEHKQRHRCEGYELVQRVRLPVGSEWAFTIAVHGRHQTATLKGIFGPIKEVGLNQGCAHRECV